MEDVFEYIPFLSFQKNGIKHVGFTNVEMPNKRTKEQKNKRTNIFLTESKNFFKKKQS